MEVNGDFFQMVTNDHKIKFISHIFSIYLLHNLPIFMSIDNL